jgi:carbon starvation protein
MLVVVAVLYYGVRTLMAASASGTPSTKESPFVAAQVPQGG